MTTQTVTSSWQNHSTVESTINVNKRLASIDALRGLVIVFMLIDHLRDMFYLHVQVADPVNVNVTEPALFLLRLLSSLCAPIFVLLTGLSAYLYGLHHTKQEVAKFLFKRGAILVLLELTVISVAWTGSIPPSKLYLQVIWVIGLSMMLMSALIYLPKKVQWGLAITLIAGHNALDSIQLPSEHTFHTIWAILHQRDWLQITDSLSARTSYPLIPWPGIMLLGYLLGCCFNPVISAQSRQKQLLKLSGGFMVCFILIRMSNLYGDAPWFVGEHFGITLMSFFALTKYPPSLLFTLFTLSIGFVLLVWFEQRQQSKLTKILLDFGSAPMFFYISHLYIIGITYLLCVNIWGKNQGKYFGFDHLGWLWLLFVLMIVPLYFATKWFGKLKQRRKDIRWLKYF
ncbi:DUF1624 domain-containing protein [Thalassotalea marina]|uniref:Heparan-alpha-glucosaminide N-acetyltransferase catalytic domain-containing protein n=1 Tax=Thalassotalea marina TaxID=1673741 RepID=A0A919BP82_9GAMM|nr:heparan-alpha-glucosaminide N-acetyltransferase domain-containing protein [Thalassotalea marina]GHG01525.1 hypothetical protein GCM10017161_32820 [Thalassotalea marina]